MTIRKEEKRKEGEDLTESKPVKEEKRAEPKRYLVNKSKSILTVNTGNESLHLSPGEKVILKKGFLENAEIRKLLELGKLRIV